MVDKAGQAGLPLIINARGCIIDFVNYILYIFVLKI